MNAETGQQETPLACSANRRQAALELGLFLIAFFGVWTVRATWFYAIDESIGSPILRAAYSDLLKFLLWVLPAAAFVWWVRGASPLSYLRLSVLPSRSDGWLCFVVAAILLCLIASLEVFINDKSFMIGNLLSLSPVLVLLQLVISPLFEEILFRGLVMQELMTLLPHYLANVLTSLLFVSVHLPYWLTHGGLTQVVIANCAAIFLFSVVACWMFSKTSSIWPPTLAHIANNLLPAILVGSRV